MVDKPAPRRTAETRGIRWQSIAQLVPHQAAAAKYIVLGAVIQQPEIAGRYALCLQPGMWTTELQQIIARICLSHLRDYGRVDLEQLSRLLYASVWFLPHVVDLELQNLVLVGNLVDDEVLKEAVVALTARANIGRS